MNPSYSRDEESLADGGESISSVTSPNLGLIRNSERVKVKKCIVTIGLLILVAFVVVVIGYGVVYTEEAKFTGENYVQETSGKNDRVAIFHEPDDEDSEDLPNLPEPLHQTDAVVTRDQRGTGNRRRNKTLPANATTKHPVSLLHEMGHNVTTTISGCPNAHPFFKAVMTIGAESFEGYGNNKRTAKKMAAQFACVSLYKLSYGDLPTLAELRTLIQKCGLNSSSRK
jgi:hypothetical protein